MLKNLQSVNTHPQPLSVPKRGVRGMSVMGNQGPITIIGYYGSYNAGDIWLNQKIKQWIAERFPTHTSIIEHTCQDKFATFSKIKQSDIVVFGGGSLFQDIGSLKSVAYYASLILWANFHKKPVYLISHGIGPIHRKITKFLLKIALKKCHITVRDEASYTQLEQLGIIPKSLAVTADLAYFNQSISPSDPPQNPLLLFSIKPSAITQQLSEAITELTEQNIQTQGLIADTKEDTQVSILTLQNTRYWTLQDHLNIESTALSAHLLITMRYHAAVWASLKGIPFIALSDDPKLIALTEELKQIHIPLTPLDPTEFITIIKTLLENRQNFQNKLIHEVCTKITVVSHS